jgi:UDP-glucose-4-epimerase GalE
MRVLVTGGAGYIGSQTAKTLAMAGHEPVVLDNLSAGHRSAVRWGPLVEGDIADGTLAQDVLSQYDIEAVIHFAASAYVGESVHDPAKYFRNNVSNTLTLLDAMRAVGVLTIIFSSSCATFGVPRVLPIPNDHPQQPINPYGESKLFIERVLHWYGEAYGLRWMALRYFNAAGADPDGELGESHDPETHLIPSVIGAALGHRPAFELYGTDYDTPDGTAIRDFVHVADLATAHLHALTYLTDGGGDTALNLGTGVGYSVRDVISAVESISGRPAPVRELPRRAGDPPILTADATLAQQVLRWEPRYIDLPDIIQTAWNWHVASSFPVQSLAREAEKRDFRQGRRQPSA